MKNRTTDFHLLGKVIDVIVGMALCSVVLSIALLLTAVVCTSEDQQILCNAFRTQAGIWSMVCFLFGMLLLSKPNWINKYIVWSDKMRWGGKLMIPNKKTETMVRLAGVLCILFSIILLGAAFAPK